MSDAGWIMSSNPILLYAILFGLAVVIIWVAQLINKRKSERRRIAAKTGPVIDRFEDPSKAIRPDDVILTKDDSKRKVLLWWERSGCAEGVCGVCNCTVEKQGGYLIPLEVVVKSSSYIDLAVKPIMEFGLAFDKAEAQIKEQIHAEKTPWLVCDGCVGMFFER